MSAIANPRVLLAVCVVLFASSLAHALPAFPKALKDETKAPCLPRCNLCHRDDNAGEGTIDRPFGESFVRAGGEHLLSGAIANLAASGHDSDGDGEGDIAELAAGQDPNNAYDATICGPTVGCAVDATSTNEPTLLLPALALLALVATRKKRAR